MCVCGGGGLLSSEQSGNSSTKASSSLGRRTKKNLKRSPTPFFSYKYSINCLGLVFIKLRGWSCVCVVIPFILDVCLVDAPAGVTQDFFTFLLRCLPYFFSREGFGHPFPSSTLKSNVLYPRINRSPLVGYAFLLFYCFVFWKEKSQFVGKEISPPLVSGGLDDIVSRKPSQRTYRYRRRVVEGARISRLSTLI